MADILENIASNLYNGDENAVAELTGRALDDGTTPIHILNGGLIAGMTMVGRDFKSGVLYVPDVLVAARAMEAGMNVLRPLLAGEAVPTAGRYLIGTVKGDLHDIGKNLVKIMLEGRGFEIIDLGTNVAPADFLAAVKQRQPDLLGMSALLTTTMLNMEATIETLEEAGLRDTVKIMIGGAPVTQAFAEEIGADAYAPDAVSAVDIARSLIA